MIYRVVTIPEAERDIRAAARWIHEQSKSPRTSLAWVGKLRSRIETLQISPLRCPGDTDGPDGEDETRLLTFGKPPGLYRIIFRVVGNEVQVLTVRHGARGGDGPS